MRELIKIATSLEFHPESSKDLMKETLASSFSRDLFKLATKHRASSKDLVRLYYLMSSVVDWALSLLGIAKVHCYLLCAFTRQLQERVPAGTEQEVRAGPWRIPSATPSLHRRGNSVSSWGDCFLAQKCPLIPFPTL